MLNTNIKESATNVILEMRSSNTKKSLVEKCKEYFESDENPESLSIDDVQAFIWSYDPLFTDSDVLDFCKENKLI